MRHKNIDITASRLQFSEKKRLVTQRATMAFVTCLALSIGLAAKLNWLVILTTVYLFVEFCIGVNDLGKVIKEERGG